VFWRCWYEITEPQATFPSLLSTKCYLLVLGIKLFICVSSYSLNMSFRESIILGYPKCSGNGLYRVDCTPSILFIFLFARVLLLGGFTCALPPLAHCGDCFLLSPVEYAMSVEDLFCKWQEEHFKPTFVCFFTFSLNHSFLTA